MMQKIGDQIQSATSLFSLPTTNTQPRVLDLCMAPGGYTATCLKYTPTASVVAGCLPVSSGGHAVFVPSAPVDPRVQIHHADLTMLISEFSPGTPIPADHPDASNFLPANHPLLATANRDFDLIICDGQVLRTHLRSGYRERREGTRLISAQLILALQRIRHDRGGKMLILLHKLECLRSARLVWQFSQFARVRLFKPNPYHATRSSFYMVASDIDPLAPAALEAVQGWKDKWFETTLVGYHDDADGDDDDAALAASLKTARLAEVVETETETSTSNEAEAEAEGAAIISSFGAQLISLGDPIWTVQRDALKKAPFMASKRAEKDNTSWRVPRRQQWTGSTGPTGSTGSDVKKNVGFGFDFGQGSAGKRKGVGSEARKTVGFGFKF